MSVEDDFENHFGAGAGFEGEFARALRGAAALAPESALFTLAAGAERRGRRRRNRRRAAVAGVAAAAVLAAGGVGVFADPGAGLVGPAAAEPVQPMTSEEVAELASSLLPPGSVTTVMAETPGIPGPAGNKHRTVGMLRFDDGKGAALLRYDVERGAGKPEEAAVCMDPFNTPQDSCERTVRPDGSVLVIDKLHGRDDPGAREWRGTWATPDGTVIRVIEYNGQPAAPTRETPPLDSELLASLVTAPAWARVVAALPANPGAPKPGAQPTAAAAPTTGATVPPPAVLLATLTGLLPQGARTSGADEQHTALKVEFEGRTSMISIFAEPAGARGLSDKKDAEENRTPTPLEVHEKLPDGSLLVLNQFGNGKSAVNPLLHWTAKVYYPDGRSVLLNEWNGDNGYDYRPGQPALSVEQLRAVVTAPDWRK